MLGLLFLAVEGACECLNWMLAAVKSRVCTVVYMRSRIACFPRDFFLAFFFVEHPGDFKATAINLNLEALLCSWSALNPPPTSREMFRTEQLFAHSCRRLSQ